MNNEYIREKLNELELLAVNVNAVICVVAGSCESHDYTDEKTVLDIAVENQYNLIEKITELEAELCKHNLSS